MPSFTASDPAARAGAILEIDLPALAANWRKLAAETRPAEVAAVVKADAYGLGIGKAAPTFWAAGLPSLFPVA